MARQTIQIAPENSLIALSDSNNGEFTPGSALVFDGFLETPRRVVTLSTVRYETILETAVATERTRIRIWVNHPREPDEIVIGLG